MSELVRVFQTLNAWVRVDRAARRGTNLPTWALSGNETDTTARGGLYRKSMSLKSGNWVRITTRETLCTFFRHLLHNGMKLLSMAKCERSTSVLFVRI